MLTALLVLYHRWRARKADEAFSRRENEIDSAGMEGFPKEMAEIVRAVGKESDRQYLLRGYHLLRLEQLTRKKNNPTFRWRSLC